MDAKFDQLYLCGGQPFEKYPEGKCSVLQVRTFHLIIFPRFWFCHIGAGSSLQCPPKAQVKSIVYPSLISPRLSTMQLLSLYDVLVTLGPVAYR